jgi:uncharacterized protein YecT (DUF1311 family)
MMKIPLSYRTYSLAITVVFSCFLAIANAAVISQDKSPRCPDALTQPEMTMCAREYFRKADGELNKVYKRINNKLSSADRANLTEAQRAWVKYRDTHCWAERELFHGGTLAPAVEATCLENTTVARTKELIRIYETDYDR